QPFAQAALELRPRALLVLLAIETGLHRLSGCRPAGAARIVGARIETLPTPVNVDHRADDGSGLRRQRLQLDENRVGGFRVARTLGHRIEALPCETRDAAVLVLRRVGDLAE